MLRQRSRASPLPSPAPRPGQLALPTGVRRGEACFAFFRLTPQGERELRLAPRRSRFDRKAPSRLEFRFCPARSGQRNRKNNYRGHTVMYAVLVTGGKQYRVMKGEVLRVA